MAAGGIVGIIAGSFVTLGIVVGRARFQSYFLESPNELLGWMTGPVPAAAALAGVAGWLGASVLRGALLGLFAGAAAGVALGVLVAQAVSGDPVDLWAGGIMGGAAGLAAGLLVGSLVAQVRVWRRGRNPPPA